MGMLADILRPMLEKEASEDFNTDRLKFIKTLGTGGEGTADLMQDPESLAHVVRKRFNPNSPVVTPERLARKIEIMKKNPGGALPKFHKFNPKTLEAYSEYIPTPPKSKTPPWKTPGYKMPWELPKNKMLNAGVNVADLDTSNVINKKIVDFMPTEYGPRSYEGAQLYDDIVANHPHIKSSYGRGRQPLAKGDMAKVVFQDNLRLPESRRAARSFIEGAGSADLKLPAIQSKPPITKAAPPSALRNFFKWNKTVSPKYMGTLKQGGGLLNKSAPLLLGAQAATGVLNPKEALTGARQNYIDQKTRPNNFFGWEPQQVPTDPSKTFGSTPANVQAWYDYTRRKANRSLLGTATAPVGEAWNSFNFGRAGALTNRLLAAPATAAAVVSKPVWDWAANRNNKPINKEDMQKETTRYLTEKLKKLQRPTSTK